MNAAGFTEAGDRARKSKAKKQQDEQAKTPDASDTPKKESKLAKNARSAESKALTRQRLSDLRDRTLAVRQKREAELDEYEEGRAMLAKYGPKAGVMPDKVAKRVAKRGMVIGGTFYAAMLAVFVFGVFIYKTQDIIIPPTLMGFGTLVLLGLAVIGSSYGMMSASWEEEKEGSLLGFDEFGHNVKVLGEGFRRLSVQEEYEVAIKQRAERRKLLANTEGKKKELLNK